MPNVNEVELDKLLLEGRRKLSLTGVDSVDTFSQQNLALTISGTKVKIGGENIKITAFNKSTGTLTADGVFNEIKYGVKKTPLVKRLFR